MKRNAFTLLELIASTAVLMVLFIVLMQVVGAVSSSWRRGTAKIDNLAQARAIMGLLDRDIQSMVLRKDLGAFCSPTGDTTCAFYTRIAGGDGTRRLSLVSYQINDRVLARSDYELDYGTKVLRLTEPGTLADLNSTSLMTDNFAEGVLLFAVQFVAADGSLKDKFNFNYPDPQAQANTRAVVISMVVLDTPAYMVARERALLPALEAEFVASSNPAGTIQARHWNSKARALPASFPEPVRAGVNVFERTIAIPLP